MDEYHKILTVYKRDPDNNYKTLLEGEFAIPEFEYLQDNEWEFTEKVDGTNVRVMLDGKYVRFAGKTDRAQLHPHLVVALNTLFPVDKLYSVFEDDRVCLYGEGYGSKIQSGGKYRSDQGFVLFDVKVGDWWLRRKDVEDIAEKLGINIVPGIGHGTLLKMVEMAQRGFISAWGNFIAEGIVARPTVELFARNGNRIITKIKYKDFAR